MCIQTIKAAGFLLPPLVVAAMWYRDVPVFVVSVCTLGMVITRERENDVRLIVYNTNGKRLKEYRATETYCTSGIGLPLSGMINDKVRS